MGARREDLEELERALDRGEFEAIVVHLLGLDDCKDRGLPTDGAMVAFRRLTRAALVTDRNIVANDGPLGEKAVPFFALLTTTAGEQTESGKGAPGDVQPDTFTSGARIATGIIGKA